MNWGHYIIASFIVFALVIATMVTISMKQDVNLVSADYYKQEIAYQSQIDKIAKFKGLSEKPIFKTNSMNNTMEVFFPQSLSAKFIGGTINLYRPSESGSDRKIRIDLEKNGTQQIPLQELSRGLWKAKIDFQLEESHYYHEKIIIM